MDLAAVPLYFCPWRIGGGLLEVSLVSVIEHSESVRWAVARTVRSAGFGVEVFASAEEFILSDQVPRTSCLILDVQLPGMSGLQLQSHLAAPRVVTSRSSSPLLPGMKKRDPWRVGWEQ